MMSTPLGKAFTIIGLFMVSTQMFLLAFLTYLYFEPPYLTYGDLPFHVLTPVVAPGNVAQLVATRCNRDKVPHSYVTSREVVSLDDGSVLIQPSTVVSISPGCTQVVSNVNTVPTDAKPGRYYLRGWADTSQTFKPTVAWYSEPFEVRLPPLSPASYH